MTELNVKHADMVLKLAKNGQQIIDELDPVKADSLHMAVGVSGEAGELLDAIKKYAVYGKPLDRENVIEELGDLEFYLQGIRNIFDISREKTLQANIDKLAIRYPNYQYTNQAAQDRADKTDSLPVSGLMGEIAPMYHETLAHDYTPPAPKPPHQQRVIEEHDQLVTKLNALTAFIGNTEQFCALCDEAERGRLEQQQVIMQDYAAILQERINAF